MIELGVDNAPKINTAEMSNPRRKVKKDLKDKSKKSCGRKSTAPAKGEHKRRGWQFNPALWAGINAVCQQRRPFTTSASELVEDIRKSSPAGLYDCLLASTLRQWIDQGKSNPKDGIVWKENVKKQIRVGLG